jgi:hypothetical protein
LLDPHDPVDQKRISILRDTSDGSIWSGFNDNPATIPAPYSADWLDINDWADSVAKVGPLLKDTVKYCKTVPIGTDATKDAQFQNKQKAVLAALGSSMRNSEAAFDKSFSLCVMATLAGRTPGTPAPSFEAGWNGKTIFESAAQVVPAQLAAGAGGQ